MSHARRLVFSAVAVILIDGSVAASQEPAPAAAPAGASSTSSSSPPASSSKGAKHKHTWADDFLIHGSVFTDKGRAFPGVQIRVRRVGDKKFRWEDASNSRGDFAIRVPKDASYEVIAHAKGVADQTRTVKAQSGLTDETLAFQMQPAGGKK